MTAPRTDLFTVHVGDARQLNRLLSQVSKPNEPGLTCTITSPPYGNLKNYGSSDQIGWGQPYDEYLAEMRRVFRNIYQHTRDDGSMWVVADTYLPDEGRRIGVPQAMTPLPFHLAEEATDCGWILREVIVWQKNKTLPWTSGQRLRNGFEYVLLFVKSGSYKFRTDRLREVDNLEEWWVKWPERYNPNGKAPINIWDVAIPQQGTWGSAKVQHACPLPSDLVERLLYLSTDEGDVVFDPFAGTGTVVAEANRLSRRGIGIELNPDYVKEFRRTVQKEVAKRNSEDVVSAQMERARVLRSAIISLRAVKYPKVLWQGYSKLADAQVPSYIAGLAGKIKPETMADASHPLSLKTLFVYRDDMDDEVLNAITRQLKDLANRSPLTKFGIACDPLAVRAMDLDLHLKRERLYLYERGRTWDAVRRVVRRELGDLAPSAASRRGQYAYPPIVSNLDVHEQPGQRLLGFDR